jgi:hypothetical protein
MKATFILLGLASWLLGAGSAQAQVTFRVGPQVGLSSSTAAYTAGAESFTLSSRRGLEAGLVGVVQKGHLALQPTVLFAQRGFDRHQTFYDSGFGGLTDERIRLNYLTVSLPLAYTQHTDGQGVQVFGGPYAGFLLGGKHELLYQFPMGSDQNQAGDVVATDVHTVELGPSSLRLPDYNFYSRRFDLGVQAGLGYRLGGALLQVSYSLGLRNLGPTELYTIGSTTYSRYDTPYYRNRAVHVSLSYLFG